MKKTWHIGERCKFGTFKIIKHTENSVKVGLFYFKQAKVQIEKTFTDEISLIMWLEDAMDSYHAGQILDEIKDNGILLKQNTRW